MLRVHLYKCEHLVNLGSGEIMIVFYIIWKRDSRVVSALASCARGPGFDPRRRRGKFVGPSLLPFVSFA